MDLNLKNKVIIVTGGSEGIGRAITQSICDEGGIPVIATRSQDSADELIEKTRSGGTQIHGVYGELQDSQFCQRVISEAYHEFGSIDGLVNNAGVNDKAGLEAGPQAFRDSLSANLFHCYDLVHFALPYLKQSRGSIVNISSKVALTGQGGTSGYAAAKAAQCGLTREWAADLTPFGIRVNAVLPAEVMTPLYRKWLATFDDPERQKQNILNKIPLEHRMTTTAEIAAMVVFLLSERSAHTTGQLMVVDGGYVHLDRALT